MSQNVTLIAGVTLQRLVIKIDEKDPKVSKDLTCRPLCHVPFLILSRYLHTFHPAQYI